MSLGLPVAFGRLDHVAHADRLRRYLDPAHFAIHQGANLLNVRSELALGDPRRLLTDASKVLGLSLSSDRASGSGFLACEITNSWHDPPSCTKRRYKLPRGHDDR